MEKVGTPYFSSISIIYVSDDTHSKCITNDVFLGISLNIGGKVACTRHRCLEAARTQ